MKIAVCGAGRGGTTLAADFALMGHDVTLYQHPNFAENLEYIRKVGGISIHGTTISGKEGKVMPKLTTDAAEAVKGARVVLFAVPAFGHEGLMSEIIPHLEDGQVVIVNTGYFAGLRFRDQIFKNGRKVLWVETELLPYLTELPNPAEAYVMAVKANLGVATLPACYNEEAFAVVKELYPMAELRSNILEIAAICSNELVHMPLILLNLGNIDRCADDGHFDIYGSGVSRKLCKVIETMDLDKIEFMRLFGIEVEDVITTRQRIYPNANPEGKGMYEFMMEDNNTKSFNMMPREYYAITEEDIGYGLVPMASIARSLGKELPMFEAFINMYGAAYGKSFWETGITAEKLGLAGKSAEEILHILETGE